MELINVNALYDPNETITLSLNRYCEVIQDLNKREKDLEKQKEDIKNQTDKLVLKIREYENTNFIRVRWDDFNPIIESNYHKDKATK